MRATSTSEGPRRRPAEAVISGYVLRLIREFLPSGRPGGGLSQEQLGELLGVDRNTIQGWETGRRPLTSTPVRNLMALEQRLRSLGAPPVALARLRSATEADYLLDHVLAADPDESGVKGHPLATLVIKRSLCDLLAWPLLGRPPAGSDRGPEGRYPRRGPVAPGPELAVGERECFFARLRSACEQSLSGRDGFSAPAILLRRQVYYLAAWDESRESQAFLADVSRADSQRPRDPAAWSPSWAALRSLLVARARLGDPEPLRHFIRASIASDQCQSANLNYWAYWTGELPDSRHSDEFMASEAPRWRGSVLLRRLLAGLEPDEATLDLYVHSLWSLLVLRPVVLADDPQLAPALLVRTEALLESPTPSPASRDQLAQIRYATRAVQR